MREDSLNNKIKKVGKCICCKENYITTIEYILKAMEEIDRNKYKDIMNGDKKIIEDRTNKYVKRIDRLDKKKETALIIACRDEGSKARIDYRIKCIELLLKYEASVDFKNEFGVSAFSVTRDPQIQKVLMKKNSSEIDFYIGKLYNEEYLQQENDTTAPV